ncbi:MAG: thioredoxin family protein [Pseudomonadota bacterium]
MLGCLVTAICVAAAPADAAELLMVEEDWCPWCERWNDEVGVIYAKTPEGRRAPLRRIDIHGALPDDVVLDTRPRYTPTFILIDGGREIARIEGYPGEDFFWGLLGRMLEKLPAPEPAPAASEGLDQS